MITAIRLDKTQISGAARHLHVDEQPDVELLRRLLLVYPMCLHSLLNHVIYGCDKRDGKSGYHSCIMGNLLPVCASQEQQNCSFDVQLILREGVLVCLTKASKARQRTDLPISCPHDAHPHDEYAEPIDCAWGFWAIVSTLDHAVRAWRA